MEFYNQIGMMRGSSCTPILGLDFTSNAGTSNVNRYPAYGLYDYSHSMFIIQQSEIGAVEKQIENLQIDLAGYSSGYTFTDQTIKLAHVTESEFGTNVQVDLSGLTVSDLTEVKSSFTLNAHPSGWKTLTFDTNFCYNGTDNLLIIWENRDGSYQSGYGYAECWSDNTNYLSWYKYQDNTYPTGFGTRDLTYRPNFKLGY